MSGNAVRCVVLGDIELHKFKDPYQKLGHLFSRIVGLVESYSPDEVALESPFFGKNVQSMLKLGRAQGVAMAAALSLGKPVAEYAPRRIKQAITGNGAASKEQVAALLKSMLKIEYDIRHLDSTDGLAVALCHYFVCDSPIAMEVSKSVGGNKIPSGRGSSGANWESFLKLNPQREIKTDKKSK